MMLYNKELEWQEERPLGWKPRYWEETEVNPDAVRSIRDLYSMAKKGTVTGISAVAIGPDGRQYLIASGQAYTDAVTTLGGLGRLKRMIHELIDARHQDSI